MFEEKMRVPPPPRSAPLLFASTKDRFSRVETHIIMSTFRQKWTDCLLLSYHYITKLCSIPSSWCHELATKAFPGHIHYHILNKSKSMLFYVKRTSLARCFFRVPGLQIREHTGKLFSYYSTKHMLWVLKKNRLNETVLLSTQNTCFN